MPHTRWALCDNAEPQVAPTETTPLTKQVLHKEPSVTFTCLNMCALRYNCTSLGTRHPTCPEQDIAITGRNISCSDRSVFMYHKERAHLPVQCRSKKLAVYARARTLCLLVISTRQKRCTLPTKVVYIAKKTAGMSYRTANNRELGRTSFVRHSTSWEKRQARKAG